MSRSSVVGRTVAGSPATGRLQAAFLTLATPTVLLLSGLILLSIAVHTALALRIATPWIMVDELIYAELARGIAEEGRLLVRGEPFVHVSLLYPLAVAPAWLASSMETTYTLVKVLNATLVSLTAIPIYLWARRLMDLRYALATSALTLLMPGLLYSGMIMTENVFLPAFVLATFAAALALEQPTLLRQAFALGAIGLAVSVRVQGLVLVAVLLVAIALDAVIASRGPDEGIRSALLDRIRAFRYSLALVGLLAAGYLIYKFARGEPVSSGLGAYQAVGDADYGLGEILRWTAYHAGELCLAAGVIPVSAFLILFLLALHRGAASAAERAFLAVAAAALVCLLPTVGAFASRFALRIEERNMFYLVPLLLIALGLWLAKGAPRPLPAAVPAAAVPVVLVFFLPLERFLNANLLSDTFTFIPLLRLASKVEGGVETVEWLTIVAVFFAAQLFVVLPRTLMLALALPAVAVFFVLTSYSVSGAIRDYSRSLKGFTYADDAEWIDERLGSEADAVYLFGGGADGAEESSRLWQTEFWNTSLGTIYRVGTPEGGGLPGVPVRVDGTTGSITTADGRPLRSRYVVTAADGFELAATQVGEGFRSTLYRTPGTVGLASNVAGVYGDGWSGATASYERFAPRGRQGVVLVSVSREGWSGADVPGNVHIRVGPSRAGALERVTAERRWVVHSSAKETFALPTPKPPFRVELSVDPTFSPSTFGLPDARQLGAQVTFTFAPRRG